MDRKMEQFVPGLGLRKLILTTFVTIVSVSLFAAVPEDQRPGPDIRAPEQKTGTPPKPSSEGASRGQLLYENHCLHCHVSTLHIRQARRADSLKALEAWVIRWSDQQRLNWSPDEIADVVDYLNNRYYKLSSRPGGK